MNSIEIALLCIGTAVLLFFLRGVLGKTSIIIEEDSFLISKSEFFSKKQRTFFYKKINRVKLKKADRLIVIEFDDGKDLFEILYSNDIPKETYEIVFKKIGLKKIKNETKLFSELFEKHSNHK